MERTRSTATRHMEKLVDKMGAPVRLPDDPSKTVLHGEIRGHIKSMKKGDRLSFVNKAISSGDVDTTVAALSGPAFLSGLTDVERQHLEGEYKKARFPDESAQFARLQMAVEKLDKMQGIYTREVGGVLDWQAIEAARQRKVA